jgi:hypothetical protein
VDLEADLETGHRRAQVVPEGERLSFADRRRRQGAEDGERR